MDVDTDGHEDEMAYWRRRALALAGSLAVVALLAWACNAGRDESAVRTGASATPSPSKASGALPMVMPTVTVTATAKVRMPPKPHSKPNEDGNACARHDVVVSFTSQAARYKGGDRPQFTLSVVNTGARSCTFDVGPKALETRITSGSDKIWSSAHCAEGPGSSPRELRRGIPYIQTITWDRRRSTPACADTRRRAAPGTYVATLRSAGDKVERRVFRLR
ncbi:hypothetical protein [Thermomonospora umbrina]|uniref:DUF4232 domain-containing protein n=1 Tax=Thermomonospora umbrina TaxID=111806 RepID=A0A3D9SPT9_9ACTN|nr:hypothetical protein [Thermomonospora umbrina]REE97976.1 hypothetical protein DFJ69_3456 [Thermomonospora umbrina]